MTTDFSVIDQMFSAMLSQNESKATIDALRPKVEADVKRTAEKLADAHPASESIKRGFTIAFV